MLEKVGMYADSLCLLVSEAGHIYRVIIVDPGLPTAALGAFLHAFPIQYQVLLITELH